MFPGEHDGVDAGRTDEPFAPLTTDWATGGRLPMLSTADNPSSVFESVVDVLSDECRLFNESTFDLRRQLLQERSQASPQPIEFFAFSSSEF